MCQRNEKEKHRPTRVPLICVAKARAKVLPNCLFNTPTLTIPEACTNVEDVAAMLLTRDAAFVAHLLQSSS